MIVQPATAIRTSRPSAPARGAACSMASTKTPVGCALERTAADEEGRRARRSRGPGPPASRP
jgi:hypothetical protein